MYSFIKWSAISVMQLRPQTDVPSSPPKAIILSPGGVRYQMRHEDIGLSICVARANRIWRVAYHGSWFGVKGRLGTNND